MKKFFIFCCAILIVAVVIYFMKDKTPRPHQQFANIPLQAKWVGGVDGGCWYQILSVVSNNAFRIRIYNDNDGSLTTDTIFILNPECLIDKIDSLGLLKSIVGYDGKKILLNIPENGRNCFLQPR